MVAYDFEVEKNVPGAGAAFYGIKYAGNDAVAPLLQCQDKIKGYAPQVAQLHLGRTTLIAWLLF